MHFRYCHKKSLSSKEFKKALFLHWQGLGILWLLNTLKNAVMNQRTKHRGQNIQKVLENVSYPFISTFLSCILNFHSCLAFLPCILALHSCLTFLCWILAMYSCLAFLPCIFALYSCLAFLFYIFVLLYAFLP